MASLYTKTKLYIEANSATWDDAKVKLYKEGSGPYIKTWTYSFSGVLSKRQTEYLSWNEQLDKLYHDINDGKLDKTGSWYTHIKAVKDANSKG